MQNLNVKLNPFKDVKHVTISSNGNLVACVGNGNKAWVMNFFIVYALSFVTYLHTHKNYYREN